MVWRALPDDMVEVILGNLRIDELARISTTCSEFKAASGRRMAVQQKARFDQAVKACGAQRIACLIALIAHLLHGYCLNAHFSAHKWSFCRITAGGVLTGPGPRTLAGQAMGAEGDFRISISLNWHDDWVALFFVETQEWGQSHLTVRISRDRRQVRISVAPTHDEDYQAVSLVQAMLSEGLAQFAHEAGKVVDISMKRSPTTSSCTQEGFKAQIISLLPYASLYTPGDLHMAVERMQVGGLGPLHASGLADMATFKPQYALLRHIVPGYPVTGPPRRLQSVEQGPFRGQ
jgi:hypothetical protein